MTVLPRVTNDREISDRETSERIGRIGMEELRAYMVSARTQLPPSPPSAFDPDNGDANDPEISFWDGVEDDERVSFPLCLPMTRGGWIRFGMATLTLIACILTFALLSYFINTPW